LQFWLQLAQIDLGSPSFAVVRQSDEAPGQQAFSDIRELRRTPSGRPGSVHAVSRDALSRHCESA
jgi:hypothetical protein